DRYPMSNYGPSGSIVYWYDAVQPYVKNTQLTFCPSSSIKDRRDYGNYGVNINISSTGISPNISVIQQSAEVYYIFDSGSQRMNPNSVANPSGANFYLPGVGDLGATPSA